MTTKKISANSLILAMVAASRNCAAETTPMKGSEICSDSPLTTRSRNPCFLSKPIVAQSAPCSSIQHSQQRAPEASGRRPVGLRAPASPPAGQLVFASSRGARDLILCQSPKDLRRCFRATLPGSFRSCRLSERRDSVATRARREEFGRESGAAPGRQSARVHRAAVRAASLTAARGIGSLR